MTGFKLVGSDERTELVRRYVVENLVSVDAGEVAATRAELCVVDGEECAIVWEADVEKLCTSVHITGFITRKMNKTY